MKKLIALLATSVLLTACTGSNANNNNSTESSSQAASNVVELKPNANLLEVMKEQYDVKEENLFIRSINDYEEDTEAGKYCLFDVNGEMAPAGANDTKLQEGDVVEWKLEAMI